MYLAENVVSGAHHTKMSVLLDNYRPLEILSSNFFVLRFRLLVKVRNLDYHKGVFCRYTLNNWKNEKDVQGSYVSGDGTFDCFKLEIPVTGIPPTGGVVELAVRFHCIGNMYWDNNYQRNYRIICIPRERPEDEKKKKKPTEK